MYRVEDEYEDLICQMEEIEWLHVEVFLLMRRLVIFQQTCSCTTVRLVQVCHAAADLAALSIAQIGERPMLLTSADFQKGSTNIAQWNTLLSLSHFLMLTLLVETRRKRSLKLAKIQ
jgi:hypothetical protein